MVDEAKPLLDIVCIGEPMVEFNEQSPALFQQGFGGDTSNCAIAAARQGARVGYLTALGCDVFGDRLMALWAAENVDASHVQRDDERSTAHYFVTHGDEGHVFTYHRADSAASCMRAVDLPFERPLQESQEEPTPAEEPTLAEESSGAQLQDELLKSEFNLIVDALHHAGGNKSATATKLGISPRTLRYKLAKMRTAGMSVPTSATLARH